MAGGELEHDGARGKRSRAGPSYPYDLSSAINVMTRSEQTSVLEDETGSDEWRSEALDKIRTLKSLEGFIREVETGYVKVALHALTVAQSANRDTDEWAKGWAFDLREDPSSIQYIRANKYDAFRKVCLELLYQLYNSCHNAETAAEFENPARVFKPVYTIKILNSYLAMDRAKSLYWNSTDFAPSFGIHWYSKDDAQNKGWTDINPLTGASINKLYKWALSELLETPPPYRIVRWLEPTAASWTCMRPVLSTNQTRLFAELVFIFINVGLHTPVLHEL